MNRFFILSSLRVGCVVGAALCFCVAAVADTIRLRDGSVIRGEVVSLSDNQFTILIGNRRNSITIYRDDVLSIEFDSTTASSAGSTGAAPRGDAGTSAGTNPRTATSAPTTSTPATSARNTSTVERATPSNTTTATNPALTATPVRVRADNTTNGWTNTGIVVRKGQRMRINASGRVSLGGGRYSTPSGLRTLADPGKLMRDEATGALIAVIGNDNDDFIFVGAGREFTAQRDGVLFLGINEANLNDNTGTYDVTVNYESQS